ncbi:MAG: beta-propeller domain-containing protein, partial [Acidimicrobiales bacterium]|nr:beta-propeller domain-containing protein [Acidimicrobiales bacterium]
LENQWSSDLLLSGNRLLVMASTEPPWDLYGPDDAASPLSRLVPPGQWRQLTSIIEVDLSDPSNLVVANTLILGGRYLSARVVNGAARIVTTSAPDDLPFVYPANEAGEERAEAANREAIAQTEIADWMPRYVHEAGDGTVTDGMLVNCRDVAHPVEFSGFSTLSVLTVDLAEPLGNPSSMGVLADGQTVYAGNEHLYVATNRYVEATEGPWNEPDNDYATSIHQFDVTDPAATPYTASGTVPGHLLSQFSMSEHQGHLRVASTLGSPWWFQDESESLVTVLTRDEGELLQVGQVGEMGRGERIFAVRFIGDTGYVVTFRQTDPFYTLDLSDPTAPTVMGELKIAGYSGYLHPVGDGLILGIGQDATDEGRTTGAKATLFDVSNLSTPAVLDTWQASGGSSSVEWDHRAFLWWEPGQLAVMPFNDWRNDINAAVVLQIADGTVAEMGRVNHMPDPGGPIEFPCPTIDADLFGGAAVPEGIEAELALFVPEGITLMLCVADETDPEKDIYPWVDGYMCEFLNADDVAEYGMEFGIEALEVPEGATIGACFPENYSWMPPIERALVINDDLWSYSWGQVQANNLASLERLQTVRFGNRY